MALPVCTTLKSCMKPTLAACTLCTLWMLLYHSMTTPHYHIVAVKNATKYPENDGGSIRSLSTQSLPATVKMACVDVHVDDEGKVHAECTPHHGDVWGDQKKQIAIGGGITSTGLTKFDRETLNSQFPLFTAFIPSFCRTCSAGYHYHFYLAYDHVDGYFKESKNQRDFTELFYDKKNEHCAKSTNVTLHFVECSHHKKPAWAQNDAMVEAYIDNMEYFYRVNDDTEMQAGGWTEAFIDVLSKYSPSNVGVVGPMHSGGNVAILTYDFTHKTHIEIFGFHYPRDLTDWWADDWVTYVYQPGRSTKLNHIPLKHTLQMGQRYTTDFNKGNIVGSVIDKCKLIVKRYVEYKEAKNLPVADGKKVIAMSLFGKDPKYTYGAIRNAQIVKMFFPGWNLRFYVPSVDSKSDWRVSERLIYRMRLLGAEFIFVSSKKHNIHPSLWSLLVADNSSVEYFLIRSPERRLSDRDHAAVNEWLQQSSDKTFHCMRDHESHVSLPLVSGLWGAKRSSLISALGKSMSIALQQAVYNKSAGGVQQQFLTDVLWPAVKAKSSNMMCHDSVACDQWPSAVAFPVERQDDQFVGQSFDAYSTPLDAFKGSPVKNANCTGHKIV